MLLPTRKRGVPFQSSASGKIHPLEGDLRLNSAIIPVGEAANAARMGRVGLFIASDKGFSSSFSGQILLLFHLNALMGYNFLKYVFHRNNLLRN